MSHELYLSVLKKVQFANIIRPQIHPKRMPIGSIADNFIHLYRLQINKIKYVI